MARDATGYDQSVPLPPDLTITHLRAAVNFVEEKADELIDLYFEQANIFSAVIGILGVRALHSVSPYKRHKHPDTAQQRFPDLSLGGKSSPSAKQALESKGSARQWAIQSHYDHAGWYIVWRYGIDTTRKIKNGKCAYIWRIDVPFLTKEDWKYEKSSAAQGQGGRTHTFGVSNPKKRIEKCCPFVYPGVEYRKGSLCMVDPSSLGAT